MSLEVHEPFSVRVVAAPDASHSRIEAKGHAVNCSPGTELRTEIGIPNEEALKDCFEKVLGSRPDRALLWEATPDCDFWKGYLNNRGEQATRCVQQVGCRHADVLEVACEPVIVKKQLFDNSDSAVSASYTANISQSVSNTTSTSWSETKTTSCTIGTEISMSVNCLFAKLESKVSTEMSFSSSFMKTGSTSATRVVSSGSSVTVNLGPHETAQAQLLSNKGVLKARVIWMNFIAGDACALFDGGKKVVCYKFGDLMRESGHLDYVPFEQDIEVGFYCDDSVKVVTSGPAKHAEVRTYVLKSDLTANLLSPAEGA